MSQRRESISAMSGLNSSVIRKFFLRWQLALLVPIFLVFVDTLQFPRFLETFAENEPFVSENVLSGGLTAFGRVDGADILLTIGDLENADHVALASAATGTDPETFLVAAQHQAPDEVFVGTG